MDVAFLDPPYELARRWDWRQVSRNILEPISHKLAADGAIALRTDDHVRAPEELGSLEIGRVKEYGDMIITFMVRKSGDETPPDAPVPAAPQEPNG